MRRIVTRGFLVTLALLSAALGDEAGSQARFQAHTERIQQNTELNPLFRRRLLKLLPLIAGGEPADIILPSSKGNTALHYACAIGDVELVTDLLQHGANPRILTHRGASPADCASGPHRRQIQQLLAQADSGERVPAEEATPARPETPAPAEIQPRKKEQKITVPGEPSSPDTHEKALHELLPMIQEGYPIDYSLPGTGGCTALHHACATDDFVLVIWLLEHGAAPMARTQRGKTPEDYLRGNNAEFIRAHLVEYATHGDQYQHTTEE